MATRIASGSTATRPQPNPAWCVAILVLQQVGVMYRGSWGRACADVSPVPGARGGRDTHHERPVRAHRRIAWAASLASIGLSHEPCSASSKILAQPQGAEAMTLRERFTVRRNLDRDASVGNDVRSSIACVETRSSIEEVVTSKARQHVAAPNPNNRFGPASPTRVSANGDP